MLGWAVALLIGYNSPGFIRWLAAVTYRLPGGCGAPAHGSTLCTQISQHPNIVSRTAALVTFLALLVACRWVATWTLWPLQALITPIAQVGPQNLGYRIQATDQRDELGRLTQAIDDMMDRIHAGYEGQRRFAANASHELRTPLAVQRTLIEVGMAQPLSGDQIELLTRQLLHTNERNEQLIEGLLVLSESDQGLASRTPQRLDQIASTVIAAHQERAAAADVRLTGNLEPRVVLGEQVLLERLVTNLVQNAIKYNRPGGTVEVRVAAAPALTVINTGQTVPAEAVADLFEPFRRLSADRVDHSGGSGLGLTIARSITQAHAGTISAEPSGRDGLRVDVRFPEPG
jgi:signal transduction histidine kinase